MSERSFGSLVGYRIKDAANDYGVVQEIVEVTVNDQTFLAAVLSCGKAMRLETIAKLFSQQDMFLRKLPNNEIIVYAFPDGSRYSKVTVGSKRKRRTNVAGTGFIQNIANIRGERINISTHPSSSNPIRYAQF
jgi:hypothetical protein